MPEPIRILGIAGSLRAQSYNWAALRAAQKLVPAGVTLELFPLDGVPPYNQDEETKPPQKVVDLKARIRNADGVLLATPEYNYSIPGVLKNAIDWASRPYGDNAWDGKPVALISASMGLFGGVRAQYHLRQCFVFLNMYAVLQPEVAIGNAGQKFSEHGELTDNAARQLIALLLQNLAAKARAARTPARAAA
jgi:chromate reductase, NAD(P)H dehydrogenase (quinone)